MQATAVRLSWAKLLKRVFEIDMEHCPKSGGELKIIAALPEQPVIEKILTHLGLQARGPTEAGWRSGVTRGMRPRRTIFGGAIKAQQSSVTFKDRNTRVEGRVQAPWRRKKGV